MKTTSPFRALTPEDYLDEPRLAALNPPVTVIEPRPRASKDQPLAWFGLCDGSGAVLHYVQRRSIHEAEADALDVISYNGTVKQVGKPARAWVKSQIARLKAKRKDIDDQIKAMEGIK